MIIILNLSRIKLNCQEKVKLMENNVANLSGGDNKKLQKLVSKGSERSVYWNEYKAKSENKDKNEYRYFPESISFGVNRLYVLVYSNKDDHSEDIIYQKA